MELRTGSPVKSVVCTGFSNDAFPLIRYEVGDNGTWEERKPCPCGRQSRVLLSIEGRKDDYVVTPEGTHIMRFDYVFKDALNVREAQVVQERPGEIKLKLVRRDAYSSEDETVIKREIQRCISPTLQVSFEYVSEIERESGGKFRAVVSSLKS
jgi:phenylacetate-CoA ligase